MFNKLKIAWVGCGAHASKNLLPELCKVNNIQLVAVCDLNEEKAKEASVRFGFSSYYVDYHFLLENENIDVVFVVGPPSLHENVAFCCLSEGIHVFTEKPVTLDKKILIQLENLAMVNNCKTQVGHFLRHSPAIKNAKTIIDSENFGNPISFYGSYLTGGPWEIRKEWNSMSLDETYMYVQGIHLLDIAEYFMGPIKDIKYFKLKSRTNRLSFSISVLFKNSSVGNFLLSASAPKWSCQLQIISDKQHHLLINDAKEVILTKKESNNKLPHNSNNFQIYSSSNSYGIENRNGYALEIQSFIDSILNDEKTHPSFSDSISVMNLIDNIINNE